MPIRRAWSRSCEKSCVWKCCVVNASPTRARHSNNATRGKRPSRRWQGTLCYTDPMEIPEPSYITADEVEENTAITALGELDAEDIETLISAAEDQIDAFVGPQQHHSMDSNLDRVFPRAQDYSIIQAGGSRVEDPTIPVIPYNVSRAC